MNRLSKSAKFCSALLISLTLGACAAMYGQETTGEYLDDAGITAKVKTAILDDPALKIGEITVETLRGEVQLSGFVTNREESQRAERHARNVRGVRTVKNNLVVRPSYDHTNDHRSWKHRR